MEGMGKDSTRIIIEYVKHLTAPGGTDQEGQSAGDGGGQEERADSRVCQDRRMTCLSRRPRSPPRSSGRSGETRLSYGPPSPRANQAIRPCHEDRQNIENAEARAQAYLLVAESQSRQNQDEQATQTYSEVASAVARVQQNGLRGVLTGYLVDSLISTGRFEDARASLVLYPTESRAVRGPRGDRRAQGRRGRPRPRPASGSPAKPGPNTGPPSIAASTAASSPRSRPNGPASIWARMRSGPTRLRPGKPEGYASCTRSGSASAPQHVNPPPLAGKKNAAYCSSPWRSGCPRAACGCRRPGRRTNSPNRASSPRIRDLVKIRRGFSNLLTTAGDVLDGLKAPGVV